MKEKKKSARELQAVLLEDKKAWQEWLAGHFDSTEGVWLVLAKKNSGIKSVNYQEAVEVALCFGWIDSQSLSQDEQTYLQKFTKRGPNSLWSKINREKALDLIERGLMQPAGLAAIETARKNGRWEAAYDSFRTSETPPDLQAALNKNPAAAEFFATLNHQNRYAVLFRIQTARKSETRQKRIDQFIQMLERHEKLYP